MKKNLFLLLLLFSCLNAFCQTFDLRNCELPHNSNGDYITIQPMTGLIRNKVDKIFSNCDDPKKTPLEHYASVDLSTNKLDIKIYDAKGKLLTTTYLSNVSFQKDLKKSKNEIDPFGNVAVKKMYLS